MHLGTLLAERVFKPLGRFIGVIADKTVAKDGEKALIAATYTIENKVSPQARELARNTAAVAAPRAALPVVHMGDRMELLRLIIADETAFFSKAPMPAALVDGLVFDTSMKMTRLPDRALYNEAVRRKLVADKHW